MVKLDKRGKNIKMRRMVQPDIFEEEADLEARTWWASRFAFDFRNALLDGFTETYRPEPLLRVSPYD